MAFKQVRHRASLFRPWATHPLKQQRETTISLPNHPELPKESYNLISAHHPAEPQLSFSAEKELSAFKAATLHSSSSLSRTDEAAVFQSGTIITSPTVFNLLHEASHLQQMLPYERSLIQPVTEMKSNAHLPCPWELHFPLTTDLCQPLDRPSSSKWKTKKQRPKRFQCPHCQVSFSNNGQLKGHIRIHTGERPFACEHPSCGKAFTRNEELTRHKRIHTGVRPHPCLLCGKRFGRKDHLKKHVKTHQRAFSCFDCVPWFG